MTDRFQQTIEEIAARREVAKEAIRRMRDAIERSKQLLRESDEQLKPAEADDDGTGATSAETAGSAEP
ncbi:MAG TPA: hypothetical protein VK399_06075 [Longimicrobiaceae bacterium]|nr:hypothetical protein [Longimicrobiaceae bacterium]